MDDFMKSALEIVRAQAGVRVMSEDEVIAMTAKLADKLRGLASGETCQCEKTVDASEIKKSIKEKSVTCLECGKTFKILTKKHLALHGLSPNDYKEKYGMKKNTSLVAKELVRERRKKMQDMKLWERIKTRRKKSK